MMQWTFVILLTGLLSLQRNAVTAQSGSQYIWECDSWRQTVQSVNAATSAGAGLNVSCQVNAMSCTGFTCMGSISALAFSEELSFGVKFVPCTQPIDMPIFINVSGANWQNTIKVGSSPSSYNYAIPGATKSILGLGSVTGNASIFLQSVAGSQPEQAILEVNFTLSLVVGQSPPRKINYVVVPRGAVALPSCISAPSMAPTTKPASVASPLPPTGPGKVCVLEAVHQCEDHQQCIDSKCMCLTDYSWDGKVCVSRDTASVAPATIPANDHTLMIILSCVAVALGLGVVIAIIRCRYVRYRQRYGQHDLLVNEADNNLDEVDPPMIEA